MARLLIKKEKREYIPELDKEVTVSKFKQYYIEELNKDFSTEYGVISRKDLKKKGRVLTDKKKEFIVLEPGFIDRYQRIIRLAQMPLPKDIGLIIAETGTNKNSKVVDAGGGSGGIACFLAAICKEVTTYEIKKEHCEIIRKNKEFLGLKNLKIKNADITKGIDEMDVDAVILDMPSPWNAIKQAEKALKQGGFLVIYSPTINMTADFVKVIKSSESFLIQKTIELIAREWKVEEESVRPKSQATVHSGFLTFVRKVL